MGEEAKIEKAVCVYAKKLGCYVRKFTAPSQRGVPDRLFISKNGDTYFIEFKAKGKLPSALQYYEMAEINKRGGNAHWVDSVEEGKKIVDFYNNLKDFRTAMIQDLLNKK